MSIGLPRIVSLFQPRWEVFWATTYSFELELFDNFLLRRLGDPPLNATILADVARLAKTWGEIPLDEGWRLRRANRDYLIRGYPVGSGSLHAKTYFFADGRQGALLIGSGNLGRQGLDRGREVFCQFDSSDDGGRAVIASWQRWMHRLVEQLDDALLLQRWGRLRQQVPWLEGLTPGDSFVANLDQSMLDQLTNRVEAPVDELLVGAPFFDPDAAALEQLIAATAPRAISFYAGVELNVDGGRLLHVLESSGAKVRILGYQPAEFVHAKLIAVVRGDRAWLLSGSANLSRAALTLRPWKESGANIEAGILRSGEADQVRHLYQPPGLELVELEPAALAVHRFEVPPRLGTTIVLLAARQLSDGRLEVGLAGAYSTQDTVYVSNGLARQPLDGSRTAVPLLLDEQLRLVWLESESGEQLSNRVPVDDPQALDRSLRESTRTRTGPTELDSADMNTPVGRMLQLLNDSFIFDVDESNAVIRSQKASEDEGGEAEDAAFWERLAREELQRDPRTEAYGRYARADFVEDNDLFGQIKAMLERTPGDKTSPTGGAEAGTEPGNGPSGKRWTPERRLQVRLGNVLERWSRKVNDPHLRWIAPLAPVRNYAALIRAIVECWDRKWVPRERLIRILQLLFSGFIAGDDERGFLQTLPDEERTRALALLEPGVASMGSALTFLVLDSKASWEAHVFNWQVFLRPALDGGIFAVDEDAGLFGSLLADREIAAKTVAVRLRSAADYNDDPHWCRAMEEAFELERVSLTEESFAARPLVLHVAGVVGLLHDPRLVPLVRHALEYRKKRGAVVILDRPGGGDSDRLSLTIGDLAYAQVDGATYESRHEIAEAALIEMESDGASWGSVLKKLAA